MILVIEHAMDLQQLPPEPAHCSLEQALRNMDWPFPVETAAAQARLRTPAPTRLPLRSAPRLVPLSTPVPMPAPAPVRPAAAAPLPMLAFAAAV
jgi:hypothetical protein